MCAHLMFLSHVMNLLSGAHPTVLAEGCRMLFMLSKCKQFLLEFNHSLPVTYVILGDFSSSRPRPNFISFFHFTLVDANHQKLKQAGAINQLCTLAQHDDPQTRRNAIAAMSLIFTSREFLRRKIEFPSQKYFGEKNRILLIF